MNHGAPLRAKERVQFLGHLAALGAPDPETRAAAALRVAQTMARKGLSWSTLIPGTEPGEQGDAAPADWRAEALELVRNPELAEADRAFLLKLAAWRAPGVNGLRRLREIAGRVAGNT